MPRDTPQTRKPVRLATVETTRTAYIHHPEFGATPETVQEPSYWQHVAKTLRPGDLIDVYAADLSWYSQLLVRAATRNEVTLALVHDMRFPDTALLAPNNEGLSVKWRGGGKWSVIRDKDGEVLKAGFAEESAAHRWLEQRVRVEAA